MKGRKGFAKARLGALDNSLKLLSQLSDQAFPNTGSSLRPAKPPTDAAGQPVWQNLQRTFCSSLRNLEWPEFRDIGGIWPVSNNWGDLTWVSGDPREKTWLRHKPLSGRKIISPISHLAPPVAGNSAQHDSSIRQHWKRIQYYRPGITLVIDSAAPETPLQWASGTYLERCTTQTAPCWTGTVRM